MILLLTFLSIKFREKIPGRIGRQSQYHEKKKKIITRSIHHSRFQTRLFYSKHFISFLKILSGTISTLDCLEQQFTRLEKNSLPLFNCFCLSSWSLLTPLLSLAIKFSLVFDFIIPVGCDDCVTLAVTPQRELHLSFFSLFPYRPR